MAEEGGKGVALAILGIVAVIAIVGLVLLFAQAKTGQVARGYAFQGGQFAVVPENRATDDFAYRMGVRRGVSDGFPLETQSRIQSGAEGFFESPANDAPVGVRLDKPFNSEEFAPQGVRSNLR